MEEEEVGVHRSRSQGFSSLAKHFHFLYEGTVVNGLKEETTFHFRLLKSEVRDSGRWEGQEEAGRVGGK